MEFGIEDGVGESSESGVMNGGSENESRLMMDVSE
jgi:hypothetical protein